MNTTVKECKTCGEVKPIDAFHKAGKTKKGTPLRRPSCKECMKPTRAERYANESEAVKEYQKQYRLSNPEKVALGQLDWRERNPEYHSNYHTRWRAQNPEKARAKDSKRRLTEADAFLEDVLVTRLAERDGTNCCYCGTELLMGKLPNGVRYTPNHAEHEHILAVENGGLNSYENSALACAQCNRSKGDTPLEIWLDRRRALGRPIELNSTIVIHLVA